MTLSQALLDALSKPLEEGVRDSVDLRRVRDLPVLDWRAHVDQLRPAVTKKVLHRPAPCRGGQVQDGLCSVCGTPLSLRDIQVAMLAYAHEFRGGFFPARTGAGKMLVSLLLPTMVGAKKPALMLPASRVDPTYTALSKYKLHWTIVPPFVLSYERLSQVAHAETLVRLAPDCLTLDEAHMAKDPSGARWKRMMPPRQGRPGISREVPFFAMSGSFASRALDEYRHLCVRALGPNAPVPHDWIEGQDWARAMNARALQPLEPGKLLTLMPAADGDGMGREAACARYGRRLVSAPGVVSSGHDIPDVPLTCSILHVPPTQEQKDVLMHLQTLWETPCGWAFEEALELARHQRACSVGIVQRWKVAPPPAWKNARKAYSMWLRGIIAQGKLDTPDQVLRALEAGQVQDEPDENGDMIVARWKEIEPTFTPEPISTIFDRSTAEYAARWLADTRGIVWTMHPELGELIEELTGVPYFREAACDARGVHIEKHRGPCVASVQSCGTGQNLQHHQHNLILTCPPNGMLEQLVSRTHRDGQKKPVSVQFVCRMGHDYKAIENVRTDAASVGASMQCVFRVSYADWT